MVELVTISTPIVLVAFVYMWIQDVRGRKYRPWVMCGVQGLCDCPLNKVCVNEQCKCSRTKVCIDHACQCGRVKAYAEAACNCGRSKVILTPHARLTRAVTSP
jgi:hypothetical protein